MESDFSDCSMQSVVSNGTLNACTSDGKGLFIASLCVPM